MGDRAQALAKDLASFSAAMTDFVTHCSDADWQKRCSWEDWSVGVTARHVAAGHFSIIEIVRSILDGASPPDFTMDQIVEMANQHARQHADTTRTEVLNLLAENGAAMCTYVAGLSDTDLDRTFSMTAMGGDVSILQLVENVVLHSGGSHLDNMKKAAAE